MNGEQLLILAPADANDRKHKDHVLAFADEGVAFPFDDDYGLPRELPGDLTGVRCVVLDPARREEFEAEPAAEALRRFRLAGGHVWYTDPNVPSGGGIGDSHVRHHVMRCVNTAGLRNRDPLLLERMQARDEQRMLPVWKAAARDEFAQYTAMRNPFGDPPGYITLRVCTEAAEFFGEPELAQPAWEYLETNIDVDERWERCGAKQILMQWRRTGDERYLNAVLSSQLERLWQLDGAYLNVDLRCPEGGDPTDPPAMVRENAWIWPETTCAVANTFAVLATFLGDTSYFDRAMTHVRAAHQWLFDEQIMLWQHVGRPSGPDRRSVPWGRGNCWFLYALRGLLDELPEDHPYRAELVAMLAQGLEGFLRFQTRFGLWHNVLDMPTDGHSRQCASATSRIMHVYARAYHRGWLRDDRIPEMCERAWLGLKTKIWDDRLFAVCVGTSHSLAREVYVARPMHTFRVSRSELLLGWMEMERMRASLAG